MRRPDRGRSFSFIRGRRLFVALPLALLIGVAVGISSIGTGPRPRETAIASTATSPAGTAAPRDDQELLTAPGIAFRYPETWIDETVDFGAQDSWAHRTIAYLVDGPPPCWLFESPAPVRTIKPTETCDHDPESSDTLSFSVAEYLRPVPGDLPYRQGITFDPHVPWEGAPGRWYVIGPDYGLYTLTFSATPDELDKHRQEMLAVIASLDLTAWSPAPDPVVDGWIRLPLAGASFAFPSTWHPYGFTPGHVGMTGSGAPLAMLSSAPLAFCEAVEDCHLTKAPPGTIAVRFRQSSSAFSMPDWTLATERVGGQPALLSEDTLRGITIRTWDIRLPGAGGNSVFTIDAAISGEVGADLLAQLDGIIARMEFPSPAPP